MQYRKIAMIGFGEAAMAFSANWTRDNISSIYAFDIKFLKKSDHPAMPQYDSSCRVTLSNHIETVLDDADLVFSLVTADCAHQASKDAAPHVKKGAIYFDCNSCSPNTKKLAKAELEPFGVSYIDVAVMAPVEPKKHKTPLLISGKRAEAAMEQLQSLGMVPNIAGAEIGHASSIKMFRSIMIKGIEALSAEAMLCAHRAGVSEQVLASLQASDPGIQWQSRSSYNLERMMVHGIRRAAEMNEVVQTVEELGLPSHMSKAIAQWQQQIGDLHLAPTSEKLSERTEQILNAYDRPA